MVRTIEQILGAEPLNQKVAAATPMFDAFQTKPDNTPFTAVPNQIPLTENIDTPPACGLGHPGQTGRAGGAAPVAAGGRLRPPQAWETWAQQAAPHRPSGAAPTTPTRSR